MAFNNWPIRQNGAPDMAHPVAVETSCSCGSREDVVVEVEDWERWREGAHVQDAFPDLSIDQRERLLTGTCGPCWTEMFGREEA